MTDNQENRLSMLKAVEAILTNNAAIIATPAAFATAQTDLAAIIGAISNAAEVQTQNITGTAKDKEQAANAAITKAIELIGPAKSYATATANNQFFQLINYTISSLQRIRDTALTDVLNGIKNALNDNMAALTDYGITATAITNFTSLVTAYNTLNTAPRTAIAVKAAATIALTEGFKNSKAVIMRLDGFAEAKKITQPNFYNTYKTARTVVDNNGNGKKKAAVNPVI